MEDLSDDELLEIGNFCEALRLHPQFTALLKSFELQIVHNMMSTEPHESKKREGVYASCLGVRDFQAHMNAFVQAKDKLVEKQKPEPSEYDAQQQEDID
jgi:hypothetical protein